MSFYQVLKQIEGFLSSVVETIDPPPTYANAGNPSRFAPNVQSPAIHTSSVANNGAGIADGVDNISNAASSIGSSAILDSRGQGDWGGVQAPLSLPPPRAPLSSKSDYADYYTNLENSLKPRIAQSILPDIPPDIRQRFCMEIRQELDARIEMELAQTQNDEEFKEEKKNLVNQYEKAALALASKILAMVETHFNGLKNHRNSPGTVPASDWDTPLLQYTIISLASPVILAAYSAQGFKQASHVRDLLRNPWLMRYILMNDPPRGNRFDAMLHIYHNILETSHRAKSGLKSDDIFHRLALAVAMEHSTCKKVFDTDEVIDPIARFQHYEGAYLRGELDRFFSTLTVWELRKVVDNDASDFEIQWCRDMLKNYRPDHILGRDDQWKYCMIVKSDVRYKRPEWAPNCPRTYQQLLSGGGMCGPRAWFGRFCAKSFGIPTWGVRQPGHAAMSRWTPSGEWAICLGGPNWKKSFWDGRNGVDFDIETKARLYGGIDYEKVILLDCLAEFKREKMMVGSQDRNFMKRDVNEMFWQELRLCQMKLLAKNKTTLRSRNSEEIPDYNTVGTRTQQSCRNFDSDQIHIPASACHKSENVIFMDTFDDSRDRHIHLRENGCLEYQVIIEAPKAYLLHVQVVTVHANSEPIKLKVSANEYESDFEIDIPYSRGYWATTEPIRIELNKGLNTLQVRRYGGLGITMKEFILTPSI